MLDSTPFINIPAPILSPALAMLPDEAVLARAEPEQQPAPAADSETLESFFTEAVAFVNQARKILPHPPGEESLHSGERGILRVLEKSGPCTVPQIARAQSTSRQNVQIIINRLSAEGQVEFRANPAHQRSKLVALTVRGKLWLEAFNQAPGLAVPPGWSIPEAEIREAAHLLRRLRKALANTSKNGGSGK